MKTTRIALLIVLLLLTVCAVRAQQVPTPDHVIIVIYENHGYTQIIGSSDAPYINSLANDPYGALFTQSHGVTHPSQPNYLYLFSGSSQNVILDFTPFSFLLPFTTANLGANLLQNGRTFVGYSEDQPSVGYTGDNSGAYYRKHNPWVNWQDGTTNGIPSALNQPLTSFPASFSSLPTLCFVIPNEDNDMHNGTVAAGDAWLQNHLDSYAQWAKTNNSLLIVTFDEDDGLQGNRIATIFIGQMVKAGQYGQTIDHNDVLRTLEDMYGLSYAGSSSGATTITNCWVFRPVSALSANMTTICPGESVQMTDMTTNAPTAWTWSFPGGTPALSTDQNPMVSYNSSGMYDVVLITSNHMGYDTLVKSNYITVQPNLSLMLSDDSLAICAGDTATVTVSGATTYDWLPGTGIISTNGNTLEAAPSSNTIYWVTGSLNGCSGDTVAVAIDVNPLPVVTASPDSQTICEGASVTLTAQGAGIFHWSPSAGLDTTSGTTVTVTPSATTTYIATGTNNGCSSETTPLHIIVNPKPYPVVTAVDSALSSTPAESYQWYLDDQPIPGAILQNYIATTSGDYKVEVVDAEGCSNFSNSVSVTLLPNSIKNLQSGSFFMLYPNPNGGRFVLHMKNVVHGEGFIEVRDVAGRTVYHATVSLHGDEQLLPLNVTFLQKGIYLVALTNNDQKESVKVLIY